MTKRKNELEKRIDELLGEREGLSSTLDHTSDKILMLERLAREQESQVRFHHTFKGLTTRFSFISMMDECLTVFKKELYLSSFCLI